MALRYTAATALLGTVLGDERPLSTSMSSANVLPFDGFDVRDNQNRLIGRVSG